MTNVLITGTTGNVGAEVIRALNKLEHSLRITAAVRDPTRETGSALGATIGTVAFDFTDHNTYASALKGCEPV